MYSANLNPDLQQIHRQHLWQRLQRRMTSAQGDPTRLALLAREARALGFRLPLKPGIPPYTGATSTPDRLTQTLQSLAHLRVEH